MWKSPFLVVFSCVFEKSVIKVTESQKSSKNRRVPVVVNFPEFKIPNVVFSQRFGLKGYPLGKRGVMGGKEKGWI
jgi:hypothetical protein